MLRRKANSTLSRRISMRQSW